MNTLDKQYNNKFLKLVTETASQYYETEVKYEISNKNKTLIEARDNISVGKPDVRRDQPARARATKLHDRYKGYLQKKTLQHTRGVS